MKIDSQRFAELARTFAAIVIATATAAWTARGMQEDQMKRITVLEIKQDAQDKNVAAALEQIRTDVRDLRNLLLPPRANP